MSQLDFLKVLFRERDEIDRNVEELQQLSHAFYDTGNPVVSKTLNRMALNIKQAIEAIYKSHGEAQREDLADIQRMTAENFKAILTMPAKVKNENV